MFTFRTEIDTSGTYLHEILSDYWQYDEYIIQFKSTEYGLKHMGKNIIILMDFGVSIKGFTDHLFYDYCNGINIEVNFNGITIINIGFADTSLEEVFSRILYCERLAHKTLERFSEFKYSRMYINFILELTGFSFSRDHYIENGPEKINIMLSNLEKLEQGELPEHAYDGMSKKSVKSAR